MPADYVDGPTFRGVTTYQQPEIPEWLFETTVRDVRTFIAANHRLPSEIWVGSQTLSLADFAATLAAHVLSPGPIRVAKGKLEFEQYFSNNAAAAFGWPIHPKGFAPSALLELARLQGWTLKPARLR